MISARNIWTTLRTQINQVEMPILPHSGGYILNISNSLRKESNFKTLYNQIICSLILISFSLHITFPSFFSKKTSSIFIVILSLVINLIDYLDTYYIVYYRRYSRLIFVLLLLQSFGYLSVLGILINQGKITDISLFKKFSFFFIWATPFVYLTFLLGFGRSNQFFYGIFHPVALYWVFLRNLAWLKFLGFLKIEWKLALSMIFYPGILLFLGISLLIIVILDRIIRQRKYTKENLYLILYSLLLLFFILGGICFISNLDSGIDDYPNYLKFYAISLITGFSLAYYYYKNKKLRGIEEL